jgi:hypothetical protein
MTPSNGNGCQMQSTPRPWHIAYNSKAHTVPSILAILWKARTEPKFKIFDWTAMHQKIPTGAKP